MSGEELAQKATDAAIPGTDAGDAVALRVPARWYQTVRFKRLVIAHVVAYVIVLPWAAGWVPIALRMMPPDEVWSQTENEAVHSVLLRLIAPSALCFVFAHLTALPWVLGKDAARGMRVFVALDVMLASIGVFGGAASWILFLYK